MRGKLRRWWPAVKAVLGLAIVLLIGRRFASDLASAELWARPWQPAWLVLSGLLYLAGLSFSALYWGRLLAHLKEPAPPLAVARAYFVGHLGKYIPFKAYSLVLRADLVRQRGVSPSLAGLTTFYEVLTTMASGALLAAGLFAACGPESGAALSRQSLLQALSLTRPEEGGLGWAACVGLALLLAAATGLPVVPALFNRVAHHLTLPFRDRDAPLPAIRLAYLLEGLALTAVGWLLLGISLWCALRAVVGPLNWPPAALARLPASLAVAYVAGFVILVAPGGIGVREFFLVLFLGPELVGLTGASASEAESLAVGVVVALRLAWTAAEFLLAALLFFAPAPKLSVARGAP